MSSNYSPGLEGVIAGISGISEVDAENSKLTYRGYDVQDLVDHCVFEEVAYLMLYGNLPNQSQFNEFVSTIAANSAVPNEVFSMMKAMPKGCNLMDLLKASVSTLALFDPDKDDNSREANLRKAVRLLAQIPNLVVNGYRITRGMEQISPDSKLSHSANFFRMLQGEVKESYYVDVLNITQILYAEHGFNASTFAARVTVSTLSDLFSGVVSAIGTLKGALHGGANEAAMEMMLEIGDPSKAADWVKDALANKKKIMGFGHREYKRGDQRAHIVKKYVVELGRRVGDNKWVEMSNIMEREMLAAKNLYPNVDFPVASAYYMMGIPVELYTPMFVMSRITGYSAHIIEQLDNNRLIRPQSEYNGPHGLVVKPMAERN